MTRNREGMLQNLWAGVVLRTRQEQLFSVFLNCTKIGNLKMYHFLLCSCRRQPLLFYDRGYVHDQQGGYIGYDKP